MRNEMGERREWETLKATVVKWGEGRRNRTVTEKKGRVVQLISPPGEKSWESQRLQPKKGPSDLRGKKKKPNKRPKNKFRKSTKKYDNI
jgi:5-deoxy-D-glucuronate isomerase